MYALTEKEITHFHRQIFCLYLMHVNQSSSIVDPLFGYKTLKTLNWAKHAAALKTGLVIPAYIIYSMN
jgi:hypothetical protein